MLGLSDKKRRFPKKGTCLAIYSRAVNAGEPLEAVLLKQYPWCAEWKEELRALFEAYVEAKQKSITLPPLPMATPWRPSGRRHRPSRRGRRWWP